MRQLRNSPDSDLSGEVSGHVGAANWLIRRGRVPFARASEEPYRRRLSDGVRLAAALLTTAWLAAGSEHNSDVALSVFHAVNGLPGDLRPVSDLLYDLATLWTVGVIAAAALWAWRWRLARDLVLAGLIAWLTARGLGLVLQSGLRSGLRATIRSRSSADFPDVPLAVVVAVVATATPYLTRPLRWLSRAVALLLVPAEMYLGTALPKSLACAIAVGVLAAATIHLAFGSPAGRATPSQVQAALRDLGLLAVRHVRLAERQPPGHTLMLADDGDTRLLIKVLGRDERDAQVLAKLWKSMFYRHSGPTLFLTRLQEVEHQAYVMLLAQHAGVRVAPMVIAGTGGRGTAVLAERRVPGRPLSQSPPSDVSDRVLDDLWLQVGQLHHNRISHGRLTTGAVVVNDETVTLCGFSWATAGASAEQQAADTAELLATTAKLVGSARAVAAAERALGASLLSQALPLLQPGVLSRDARRLVGGSRADLSRHMTLLRESAAAAAGSPMPALEQLRRFTATTVALAVAVVVAFGGLLSAVGDPAALARVVSRADLLPLADALALTLASTVGLALALSGSTHRRLPFWSNLKVQLACLFSNVVLPLGGQLLQIRFLQKQGLSAAAAVAGGGLINLVGSAAAQLGLLALALQASPASLDLAQIPQGTVISILEVSMVGVLMTSVVVLTVPGLRHHLLPPVTRGMQSLIAVVRSPRQLLLLVGGSTLAYLLTSLALAAILQALHQPLPLSEVIAINVGVGLVAAVVPLPGGPGAVSAVGLSGALVSVGIPQSAAVATALLNQIVTQYVPAIPGWLALRSLLTNGDL
jgi:undecaprenyl-diphosphatase